MTEFVPTFSGCNPYEKGKVDVFKVCGNWVPLTKRVRVRANGSDGRFLKSMIVSKGGSVRTKFNFWLDNPNTDDGYGFPAYVDIDFHF